MNASPIRFGTDGWRAIIDEDFNFANVERVAAAIGRYVLRATEGLARGSHEAGGAVSELATEGTAAEPAPPHTSGVAGRGRPRVLVGYDTRRMSKEFAAAAAETLAETGVDVLLATSFAPTPALATCVVKHGLDGALIVTASHNPAPYNGIKFKPPYGGSATPEIVQAIEEEMGEGRGGGAARGLIQPFDPAETYLAHVRTLVDFEAVRSRAPRVVVDVLFGASQGYFARVSEELGGGISEFHAELDPTFSGLNPEPIPANLAPLQDRIGDHPVDLALALDGDGDRVGALDPDGNYLSSHHIFALLLGYLAGVKGERGRVIKTISTTRMVDLLAARYDLPLAVTPVGFKHIAPYLLEGGALIAGEESGGIWTRGHIPERDGLVTGLLLVELLCREGPIGEQLERLYQEIGPHYYDRIDLEIEPADRDRMDAFLAENRPDSLAGRKITGLDPLDGHKYLLEDGSWLMIRPSGTEAVVRIYAEAPSPEQVATLLDAGRLLLVR